MAESPSAAAAPDSGAVHQHSGAKRPGREKPSLVEFDVEEVKTALGVGDEHMVLGIDEAGRGPVVGPMVYSGAMISLGEHNKLLELCHVADSKTLDDAHRKSSLEKLHGLSTLRFFTIPLSADDVSAAMTGRHGKNLNTLSHETAIEIIRKATLAGAGKLAAVYVDTVGPPETYQSKLSARFPHIRVVVSKKADSKYPIVSAASIEAKVTRDLEVERYGEDVGSGYPSDPKMGPWLRSHLHRFFVFPRRYHFVRHSWAPVVSLAKNERICVPIVFEQDEANDRGSTRGKAADATRPANQKRLVFAKPASRRPAIYTHMLRLKCIAQLDDSDVAWAC